MRRFSQTILAILSASYLVLAEGPPNFIVYLADDYGYGSLNAYGADPKLVRTPNLNRLAAEGVKFSRAFTTGSVCSPTRYGLLTGRYSWKTRLKRGVVNSYDSLLIDPGRTTIASWLSQYGYESAAIGKWHLGYKSSRFENLLGEISPGPLDVGFDYHFGVPNNMDDVHKIYVENRSVFGLRSNRISKYGRSFYGKPYSGYDAPQRVTVEVMEDLTKRAIKWIDSLDTETPFFLYFGSVAVHHPISPSERMRGTSAAGAYGDFIHDIDYSVGQLMEALEHRGIADNTLFLFTSDNGGDIPTDPNRPEVQAQSAGLSLNGFHRGDKHTIYNGGFAVPFIARWPSGIDGGQTSDGLVSTADILATLAEIVDGNLPKPEMAAPDSFSFLNLLEDPDSDSKRPHAILRDVRGRHALIFENWKYIDDTLPKSEKPRKGDAKELYDLSKDPSETTNIIDDHPGVVRRAQTILEAIRTEPASRTVVLD